MRIRTRGWRLFGSLTLSATLAIGVSVLTPATPSYAASYPSWDDINNAKQNESAKQAQITQVQSLIDGLNSQYDAAVAAVAAAQSDLDQAQAALDAQQAVYDDLQVRQLNAQAQADQSKAEAGAAIAQMYRSGGTNNSSVNIYLSGDEADEVLYQLGVMGRVGERSSQLYESAVTDANTASALQTQAQSALDQLTALADTAAQKAQANQEAQAALEDNLAEQQSHAAELTAQLSSLQGETAELQAQRAAGIKAEQAARAAAAAAEAARKEALANQPGGSSGGSSSGGSSATTPTAPSSSGVGFPLPYLKASSGYGFRVHPIYGTVKFHYGTDYSVTTGTAALAIANGTVTTVAYQSARGNYVDVRSVVNGQTIYARYQHLSAFNVSVGQSVSKGQTIAYTGDTGDSTGPHLHFEIHIGSINYGNYTSAGTSVNPVSWLASH